MESNRKRTERGGSDATKGHAASAIITTAAGGLLALVAPILGAAVAACGLAYGAAIWFCSRE